MATREYMAHYTHRVGRANPNDVEGPFDLADGALSDKIKLAKAMRNAGILNVGDRLRSFRVEGDKIVTFPSTPSPWHSITLTEGAYPARGVDYPGYHGRRGKR